MQSNGFIAYRQTPRKQGFLIRYHDIQNIIALEIGAQVKYPFLSVGGDGQGSRIGRYPPQVVGTEEDAVPASLQGDSESSAVGGFLSLVDHHSTIHLNGDDIAVFDLLIPDFQVDLLRVDFPLPDADVTPSGGITPVAYGGSLNGSYRRSLI